MDQLLGVTFRYGNNGLTFSSLKKSAMWQWSPKYRYSGRDAVFSFPGGERQSRTAGNGGYTTKYRLGCSESRLYDCCHQNNALATEKRSEFVEGNRRLPRANNGDIWRIYDCCRQNTVLAAELRL